MARVNLRLKDYSDEIGQMGVNLPDIDGTTRTWVTIDGEADALVTHIEAHSAGTVASVNATQATQAEDASRPASAYAQREQGLRVYLIDSTTQERQYFTVPTFDLSIGSVVAGSDELDLTASPTSAFVTWLEANALSRDGNAVTVERMVIVGRNN